MSTTTETVTRPPRAPAASVILTAMAVVSALLLAPVTSAAAAEPLPTGSYSVAVGGGQVTVEVAADGAVEIAASDGFVVLLAFDEGGRVLDEFTVSTDAVGYRVEVEVADDGSYSSYVRQQAVEGPTDDVGRIVSTVARCAPTGMVARAVGLPNHGTIVSAAASGLTLTAEVTDPVTGEVTTVRADFSTLVGAVDFCAQVDAAVPTLDEVRETLEAEAAAARAMRTDAAQERAAARAANARARAAERAAQRAAERAAERAAAAERALRGRPEEPGASRSTGGGSDGARPDQRDHGPDEDEDASASPSGGDSPTDDSGGTDTSTEDTTTDDSDGNTTDDESTGPGQGGGRPADPGARGKGPKS